MKLAEYQRLFVASLYAGERNDALFTPDTRHRFDAYAGGLRARFEESLRAAFPVTERLVGHAFFHEAAAAYAVGAPSTTWDLGRVGEGFPGFLLGHPALAAHRYVGEVARLEAELHAIFFLRDDAPGAAFPASEAALAIWRPAFSPTLRVRRYAWPVLDLYERNEPPPEGWSVAPAPEYVLLFRRTDGTAAARRLTAAQCALQEKLLTGATLTEALELIDGLTEHDVSALSSLWVSERLLKSPTALR